MKFQDMPYERIDFAKVQEEMGELIRELDAAKSGEEQFEVHKTVSYTHPWKSSFARMPPAAYRTFHI